MARNKSRDMDSVGYLDRLPDRVRIFPKMKDALGGMAGFYGFEAITPSIVEETQIVAPLQKVGVLSSLPVIFKISSGKDYILRLSGALGILRAYLRHKMNDLPHPLKFLFSGEIFSLAKGTGALNLSHEWGLCMIGEEGPIAE